MTETETATDSETREDKEEVPNDFFFDAGEGIVMIINKLSLRVASESR